MPLTSYNAQDGPHGKELFGPNVESIDIEKTLTWRFHLSLSFFLVIFWLRKPVSGGLAETPALNVLLVPCDVVQYILLNSECPTT